MKIQTKMIGGILLLGSIILISYLLYSHTSETKLNCPEVYYRQVTRLGKEICTPVGFSVEEHGKIAVAQMEHTGELVREYGAENVQVSALGYGLIKDEDYIRGMLGDQFGQVDCILQVKWPDGERVYIEVLLSDDRDGEMEYIALTPVEFEEAASSASSATWETFYANINDDQTYVLPHLLAHEE